MRCVWCRNDVAADLGISSLFLWNSRPICRQCQQLFHSLEKELTCPGCGRLMEEATLCYDCIRWKEVDSYFPVNQALYVYDEQAKEFMERYKFEGDCAVAFLIKEDIKRALKKYLKQGYTICPLPISKHSIEKREFESVEYLLELSKIPYLQIFDHIGKGKKQSEKTRAERMKLQQPFVLKDEIQLPYKILLFDDIYTTGKTIRLAAKLLQEKGIENVKLFTVFR
ncbi:ComF family protein [uncultured Granulicatella sp.]|uniref:ComF family protein n=1 Tax=uncultured Granulicatella sp. TaxID=316089 RepID=UPI0028D0B30F|nr:ComF family protein [uncultured Granulicatella sp.]